MLRSRRLVIYKIGYIIYELLVPYIVVSLKIGKWVMNYKMLFLISYYIVYKCLIY